MILKYISKIQKKVRTEAFHFGVIFQINFEVGISYVHKIMNGAFRPI